MSQSALTVTPENPTPPTNLSCVGTTPPTDPAQSYADDGYTSPGSNTTVFAVKTAAAGSGTSVDAEGRGTETSVTIAPPAGGYDQPVDTVMVGTTAAYTTTPNASHASSLSPLTNPTLTSLGTPSSVSGASGTYSQTVTGTGFTRQSVIYVNGVPQTTTFNSATSLTAPTVTKKTSAGTWPVTVVTGGVVTTAAQTWTFT
jgi:hypothetical protein